MLKQRVSESDESLANPVACDHLSGGRFFRQFGLWRRTERDAGAISSLPQYSVSLFNTAAQSVEVRQRFDLQQSESWDRELPEKASISVSK
jgi:hypothetical protein